MSDKKPYGIALLAIVLLPVLVAAQSPFDGTLKTDMSKAKLSTKPLVYVLQNGIYECKTCPIPFSIKADGQDQKVAGYPYWDTISVKVMNYEANIFWATILFVSLTVTKAWSQIILKVDCSRDRTINGALRLLTRSGGRANINIYGTCKENAVIQNPDACGSSYNSANRLVGNSA